jgi:adenylosuccinate synthase
MIITRLDTLDGWDEIKVCVAYEIDGVRTDQFPIDAVTLDRAIPIYDSIPGWTESTRAITEESQLNDGARAYISKLEEVVGVKAKIISTGPLRKETLVLEDIFAR